MKLVKIISIAAASLLLVAACGTRTHKLDGSQKVLDLLPAGGQLDSASYIYGVLTGIQINESFGRLDMSEFRKGLNDALGSEGKPNFNDSAYVSQFKISPALINEILNQTASQFMAYKAALADEIGTAYRLDFLSKNEAADSTETGLVYLIQDSGSSERVTDNRDTVVVNYRGTHLDGTEFDSGESFKSALQGGLIKGWVEGVKLVGKGGKLTLVIPGKLAYPYGYYNIEANETIIFDMEILDIHPYVEKPAEEKTTAKGKKIIKK